MREQRSRSAGRHGEEEEKVETGRVDRSSGWVVAALLAGGR